MVAIVGIPGSTHHRWKRFSVKAEAQAWLIDTYEEIRRRNPALGALSTQIMAERDAATIRYRDGNRVYPVEAWMAQPGSY